MTTKYFYIIQIETNKTIVENLHEFFSEISWDKTRNHERDFKVFCYEVAENLTPVYKSISSNDTHLVNDAGEHFELPEPFDTWDIHSINFIF